MNTAVLHRRFDPSAPMTDAGQLLMAVQNVLNSVPVVAKAASRHARRFKRDADGVFHGATSMFRRRLAPSFSLAKQPTMNRSNMASAMLMGASLQKGQSPTVSVLSMAQRRAKMIRQAAQRMLGTLTARFNFNGMDLIDPANDTNRVTLARGRIATANGPTPSVAF